MNIVDKTMDVYELSNNIYNNVININDIVEIKIDDLKIYFEMLLIIFMEGLHKFCVKRFA